MSSPQGKYWCFTYNNPVTTQEEFLDLFHSYDDCTYVCCGDEVASTGTRHFQGYIEFGKLKRLSQLKKLHPGTHWERRKGTQQQAVDYCKKDGKFLERGSLTETHQGARKDLARGIELLRQGGVEAVASEAPEVYVRNFRGLHALQLITKPPKPVPTVTLAFGPPGTGKTRRFFECAPTPVWSNPPDTNGLWFDGYSGQKSALIDDFAGRGSHWPLSSLLRVLDRYELKLPIKGGYTWWVPEFIFLTSNYHPRNWFDYGDREQQWKALTRRFDMVIWWKSVDPDDYVELYPDSPEWEHFWNGPQLAQLALDKQSGRLVSNAPEDYYNF